MYAVSRYYNTLVANAYVGFFRKRNSHGPLCLWNFADAFGEVHYSGRTSGLELQLLIYYYVILIQFGSLYLSS